MVQDFTESEPGETPDELLAQALAQGRTRAAAARVAGVSERTVYNRLADPDFRRLIGKYRRVIVDGSVGTLARFGKRAAAVLGKLLDGDNPTTQLRAACAILQSLTNLREHAEMAERLEAVEARINENRREAWQD